jgi:hypothetical protein
LQDFLQGVFETENKATETGTGNQTKGEKRSPEVEPCISTKKCKLSNSGPTSIQNESRVPCEGRSKVIINNTDNNDTKTCVELNKLHEVTNSNLSASKTEAHPTRNDRCRQSDLKILLDNTGSSLPDVCPGRSTTAMPEPRVQMLSDGKYKCYGSNEAAGKTAFMIVTFKCVW